MGIVPASTSVTLNGNNVALCPVTDQRGVASGAGVCNAGAVQGRTSHTVTFDANGGSGSMSPETHDAATALPANQLTRSGYAFTGWNTPVGGSGTSYTDRAEYPYVADVTLYAQWTARTAQSISFGLLANRTLVQSPFTVRASASSGLAVTFTTTTPAVCKASGVNGRTITLIATGTCTVRASQAGNSIYKSASVNRSFTVRRAASTS